MPTSGEVNEFGGLGRYRDGLAMAQNRAVCWNHFASDWRSTQHYLRRHARLYSRLIREAKAKPNNHDEVEQLLR